MCRAKRCPTCGKTTWAGCGQHINQVKAWESPRSVEGSVMQLTVRQ